MERLTRADIDNVELIAFENYSVHECLEDIDTVDYINILNALTKLQDYEDMEEEKQLVILPISVGDIVYTNVPIYGWFPRKINKPYEAKVISIEINNVDNFMNVAIENSILKFKFSEIGEKVFLSEEDAKQKLKEIGENNNE